MDTVDRPIQQVFRFRLRPSRTAEQQLNSHAGGARFARNWSIDQIKKTLVKRQEEKAAKIQAALAADPDADISTITPDTPIPGHFDLCKEWTKFKDSHAATTPQQRGNGKPYTGWVERNSCSAYQSAIRNGHQAFKNFFDSMLGRRKGRRVGMPRYKGKRGEQSFTVNGNIRLDTTAKTTVGRNQSSHYRRLVLPTIGAVSTHESMAKLARLLRKDDVACSDCQSTGKAQPTPCTKCDGNGHRSCNRCEGQGANTKGVPCKPCGGTGALNCKCTDGYNMPSACKPCGGTGTSGPCTTCTDNPADCKRCGGTGDKPCRTCKGHGTTKCGTCLGNGMRPYCRIVSATCTKDARGQWHVAIVVARQKTMRTAPTNRQRRGGKIGVDIGTTGLTLSTGVTIETPTPLRRDLKRLQKAGRILSRRDKGSRRRERARADLARIHGRISDRRRTFASQTATALIKRHAVIAIEGWNISDIIAQENKDLPRRVQRARRRAIIDVGAGMLRQMLAQRSEWYAVHNPVTNRYDETARTCSECGTVRTKPVPLTESDFHCDSCHAVIDRRVNAARVVTAITTDAIEGMESINARGDSVSRRSPRASALPSVKRETASEDSSDTVLSDNIRTNDRTDSAPVAVADQEERKGSTEGLRKPSTQPMLWDDKF